MNNNSDDSVREGDAPIAIRHRKRSAFIAVMLHVLHSIPQVKEAFSHYIAFLDESTLPGDNALEGK